MRMHSVVVVSIVVAFLLGLCFYFLGGVQALLVFIIPLLMLSPLFMYVNSSCRGNFRKNISAAGFVLRDPLDENKGFVLRKGKVAVHLLPVSGKNFSFMLFCPVRLPLEKVSIEERPPIGHHSDYLPIKNLSPRFYVRTAEDAKVKKIFTKELIVWCNDFEKYVKPYPLFSDVPVFTFSDTGIYFHRVRNTDSAALLQSYVAALVALHNIVARVKK